MGCRAGALVQVTALARATVIRKQKLLFVAALTALVCHCWLAYVPPVKPCSWNEPCDAGNDRHSDAADAGALPRPFRMKSNQ